MHPRPSWIIWYAVVLHALWGGLLLINHVPYGATALHIYAGMPRYAMAGLFFAASALAAYGVTRNRPTWQGLASLLPQQGLLTVSAYAALSAVVYSHYGDGVLRPRGFILADQAPVVLTMVFHTAAIVEMHARRPAEDVLRASMGKMQQEAERLREALTEKAAVLRNLEGRPRR
ncbi:MAG: hypothetical protein ACM3ML_22290 [Micromonosporaceae bacterium]